METTEPLALNAVTGIAGRERIRAFDLAAGLAVFFMILVHILWHWGARDTWTTPVGEAISFAAGPDRRARVRVPDGRLAGGGTPHGHRLAGGARPVARVPGLRPQLPARRHPGERSAWPRASSPRTRWRPYTPWWLATTVDLHHVIGLSLVTIALLRTRREPGWAWLALGGALMLVAPWLRTITVGTPFLDAPLTPVLGSAPNVYYALVPWLAFALGGAVFGAAIARAPDRTALFRRGARSVSGCWRSACVLILVQQPGFDVYTYWRLPVAFAVPIFGVILVWLFLCDWATRHRRVDARLGVVYGWSNRVIAMYFTHWIIVGWGVGLVGLPDPRPGAGPAGDGRRRGCDQLPVAVRRPPRVELVAAPVARPPIVRGRGGDRRRLIDARREPLAGRPTIPGMPIYLDHAATTPLRPEALDAMLPFLGAQFGNPSSPHAWGRASRAALDEAHERVADALGAGPREIVFTSGGTEALNLALKGAAWAGKARGHRVITTAIEHHAVLHPLGQLEKFGFEIIELPVDRYGRVDPETVEASLTDRTILVAIGQANNEVGTIQPLADVIARVRRAGPKGCLVVVDAVASAPYLAIDVKALDVDLLAVAAHKFDGPKGAGALYLRAGTHILSQQQGGTQERYRRAGTEDVAAAVGMGRAFELSVAEMDATTARLRKARERLVYALTGVEGVEPTGHPVDRLPGLVSVIVRDIDGASVVVKLDLEGIAASVGSACTTGSAEPSHVLTAMGYPDEEARGALRFSFGRSTSAAEVDGVVDRVPPIVDAARSAGLLLSGGRTTAGAAFAGSAE